MEKIIYNTHDVEYNQAFSKHCVPKINFLISQPKHNVVGTQKNCLNETFLLSTQSISLNLWVRKYSHFYIQKFCLSKHVYN